MVQSSPDHNNIISRSLNARFSDMPLQSKNQITCDHCTAYESNTVTQLRVHTVASLYSYLSKQEHPEENPD